MNIIEQINKGRNSKDKTEALINNILAEYLDLVYAMVNAWEIRPEIESVDWEEEIEGLRDILKRNLK